MMSHMKLKTKELSTIEVTLLIFKSNNDITNSLRTIEDSCKVKMNYINNRIKYLQNNIFSSILVIFCILINMISFTLSLQTSSLPSK